METDGSKTDEYGRLMVDTDYAVNLLYEDGDTDNIVLTDRDEVEKYNRYSKNLLGKISNLNEEINVSPEEFDARRRDWIIPGAYKSVNIEDYLISKCDTEKEIVRVEMELEIFKKHNLLDLLRFALFLKNFMSENDIVWGVGRGSSVASYCLYLIGIHKVDSLKYELDFGEFLK